jgi:hypothetical protein
LKRIVGKRLADHYTDVNKIDFTALGVKEKLKTIEASAMILRWTATGIISPTQELSDNVYDLPRLEHTHAMVY